MEIVALAGLGLAVVVEHRHLANELADLGGPVSRVETESAADGARHADETFEADEVVAGGFGDGGREGDAAAGAEPFALDGHRGERSGRQAEDDAADAFIADEQTTAAPQDAEGNLRLQAAADHRGQLRRRAWLDQRLGRP